MESDHSKTLPLTYEDIIGEAVFLYTVLLDAYEPGSRNGIDLEFLSTWGSTLQSHAYFIENIIMFIPLGVILPCIWKKMNQWGKMFFASFLGSLLLETVQLITGRGYFQLDDIVSNMLGGMFGYGMYAFGKRIKLWKTKL